VEGKRGKKREKEGKVFRASYALTRATLRHGLELIVLCDLPSFLDCHIQSFAFFWRGAGENPVRQDEKHLCLSDSEEEQVQ